MGAEVQAYLVSVGCPANYVWQVGYSDHLPFVVYYADGCPGLVPSPIVYLAFGAVAACTKGRLKPSRVAQFTSYRTMNVVVLPWLAPFAVARVRPGRFGAV